MPYPPQLDPATLGAQCLAVVERIGWDRWSLREVAAELGVSANALYRYTEDREGLVTLMGAAAAEDLHRALFPADDGPRADDEEAVVALSRRYVRFAVQRPDAYEAFLRAKPGLDHPAFRAWGHLWDAVNAQVRHVVPQAGDAAAFALWSLLQGRIALARTLAHRAEPDAGLEDAVRCLLVGFRQCSPVDSPLPPHARRDP